MSDEKQEPEAPKGNFTGFLHQQRQGGLAVELGEVMAEVTDAVLEQQKVGSVTLKISIAPTKDGVTVFISDEVNKKVPQPDRGGSIMYTDRDGNLTRNDPRQMTLPIRVLTSDSGEPVEVDTNTGEVKEIVR